MPFGSAVYMAQRALGRKASDFYKAECPFCGAMIGKTCIQLSVASRQNKIRYYPPHTARIRVVLKMEEDAKQLVSDQAAKEKERC